MVIQIQVQIGDTRRVFFYESAWEFWGFKKNYILREILKTRFMDFGLLYKNDEGEYIVLNDVCVADIRLASLVHVSKYCVPIELLRQNKPFRLLYLGHTQIKRRVFHSVYLVFQKVCLLLPICLPCVIYGSYVTKIDTALWHSARQTFASLGLFTFARIACLLQLWIKTSELDFSIWATPK